MIPFVISVAWYLNCVFHESNRFAVTLAAAFMFLTVWSQFKFNLLLQIFDGLFTYHLISLGVPEANPLVDDTIALWGEIWGIVYWKAFACALIALIFGLRHLQQSLTLKALTLTSTVYCALFVVSIYHFVLALVV
jgi:hypothetical protein